MALISEIIGDIEGYFYVYILLLVGRRFLNALQSTTQSLDADCKDRWLQKLQEIRRGIIKKSDYLNKKGVPVTIHISAITEIHMTLLSLQVSDLARNEFSGLFTLITRIFSCHAEKSSEVLRDAANILKPLVNAGFSLYVQRQIEPLKQMYLQYHNTLPKGRQFEPSKNFGMKYQENLPTDPLEFIKKAKTFVKSQNLRGSPEASLSFAGYITELLLRALSTEYDQTQCRGNNQSSEKSDSELIRFAAWLINGDVQVFTESPKNIKSATTSVSYDAVPANYFSRSSGGNLDGFGQGGRGTSPADVAKIQTSAEQSQLQAQSYRTSGSGWAEEEPIPDTAPAVQETNGFNASKQDAHSSFVGLKGFAEFGIDPNLQESNHVCKAVKPFLYHILANEVVSWLNEGHFSPINFLQQVKSMIIDDFYSERSYLVGRPDSKIRWSSFSYQFKLAMK